MSIPDEEYEKSLLFDAAMEMVDDSPTHRACVHLVKSYVLSVFVPLGGTEDRPSPEADDDEIIAFAQKVLIDDLDWGPNVKVNSGHTDFAEVEDVWEE